MPEATLAKPKPARFAVRSETGVLNLGPDFGLTRKAGRAFLQMTNAILRSRSARPGCFHDGKGRPERGLYIQFSGIEQDGVGCCD
jgi:hypothetical protein